MPVAEQYRPTNQQELIQKKQRFAQITSEIHNGNILVTPRVLSDNQPPIPDVFIQAFSEEVHQPQISPSVYTQDLIRPSIQEIKPEPIQVDFIQTEITRARERLAHEWQRRGVEPRQYEPEFDRVCYASLDRFKYVAPDAYLEAKRQLDEYTTTQLKTTLGERLNASVSEWKYEIKPDGLYFEGSNERAIEMFQRGRDFRKIHGNPIDHARESAEIDGIAAIEKGARVIDSETGKEVFEPQEGMTWVSFSHRGNVKEGSIYKHNFYDIFNVKVDAEGKKYIEARRYTSALTPEESLEKFGQYDKKSYSENIVPTAEYFLAHPFQFQPDQNPFKTSDDIHAYLHKEHKAMGADQFNKVWSLIPEVIEEYLKNPGQIEKLRAVFNAADETADLLTGRSGGSYQPAEWVSYTRQITQYDIQRWENQDVRPVNTGCGLSSLGGGSRSGGAQIIGAPFSVVDFGDKTKQKKAVTLKETKLKCTCPECGEKVVAKIDLINEKITCPNCEASAHYEC